MVQVDSTTPKALTERSDDDAWYLYIKHYKLLAYMAFPYKLSPHLREDMIHETGEPTLLRAAQLWDPSRTSFAGYACLCLRRAFIAWKKKRDNIVALEDLDIAQDLVLHVREHHSYDKLYESIVKLTQESRVVLVMRHWQSLSIRAIALELDISVGKAHAMVQAAEQALREKMDGV